VFVLCAFYLNIAGVSAQESEPFAVSEDTEVDSITAAEQALSLEGDISGTNSPSSATSALGILKVLFTLAVVAAAIYGIIFLIKRTSRGNRTRDPFLKVLASIPLGTNRGAHIIAVGSRAWLVGAAENGVNLISEVEDKDVLNAMLLEDSRKNAESPIGRFPDFRTLLHKLGAPTESGTPPSPDSIRKRSERLKGL
jgi:flagellar protein FliO/FliZ